ncbi:MAG: hypothetical protein LKI24_15990 [Acidipropionibacterium sp.]|jgi:hypothetical protein|nr:hypothetical protein [Acidipropionibacterium sp.]
MRARNWLLLAAGAAVATAAGRAVLRAGRAGELTTGTDGQAGPAIGSGELAGSRLPAISHPGDGRPGLRSGLRRFTDQARDFVRIVSVESAAKESELRTRLGLDDQPADRPTDRPTDL